MFVSPISGKLCLVGGCEVTNKVWMLETSSLVFLVGCWDGLLGRNGCFGGFISTLSFFVCFFRHCHFSGLVLVGIIGPDYGRDWSRGVGLVLGFGLVNN